MRWAWAPLVAYAVVLRVLWVGDTPFIQDAPGLVLHAVDMNAHGRWAVTNGLSTPHSPAHHGPLSVWFIQALLSLGVTPVGIAFWKTVITTGLTAAALCALGTMLGGTARAVLCIALLSPRLWAFARDLFDSGWSVPFACVAWTAYLHFDARQRLSSLAIVGACLTALFLTHLSSVPVVAVIATHLCWSHRIWLWRRRWAVLLVLLGCVIVASPYLRYLAASLPQVLDAGNAERTVGWLRVLTNVLRGFIVFVPLTAADFGLDEAWWRYPAFPRGVGSLLLCLRWFSVAAVAVLFFAGIWAALGGIRRRSGRRPTATADVLALAALGASGALLSVQAIFGEHYVNPIVPALVYLVWRGSVWLEAVARRRRDVRLQRGVVGLVCGWAVALAVCTAAIHWRLHDGHGSRVFYWGATLANQWEMAQELAALRGDWKFAAPRERPFHRWESVDTATRGLHALLRVAQGAAGRGGAEPVDVPDGSRIEIQYRHPAAPWNGEMVFVIHPP